MRKLGHGQSVMFFAPLEVDRRIRKSAGKSSLDAVEVLDILRWAMLETCADIQRHASLWARHNCHNTAVLYSNDQVPCNAKLLVAPTP